MKSLKIVAPKKKELDINGDIFQIQMTDVDIMEVAVKMQQEYAGVKPNDLAKISESVRFIIDFIDKILGSGATEKITKGMPVGIVYAVDLMTQISTAVIESYNESVSKEYE